MSCSPMLSRTGASLRTSADAAGDVTEAAICDVGGARCGGQQGGTTNEGSMRSAACRCSHSSATRHLGAPVRELNLAGVVPIESSAQPQPGTQRKTLPRRSSRIRCALEDGEPPLAAALSVTDDGDRGWGSAALIAGWLTRSDPDTTDLPRRCVD